MYYFVGGHYVAVFWNKKWVRGLIEKIDPCGQKNIIRLVDHGGYWSFNNSEYKPLAWNFLEILPLQAIEIFVANIKPNKSNCLMMSHTMLFKHYN